MRAFTFIVGAALILYASNGKLIQLIDALIAPVQKTARGGSSGVG